VSHDERRIAVMDGKYTFFVPEGDYRAHCLRHGEEWHVFDQGCNAVIALMSELIDSRALIESLHALAAVGGLAELGPDNDLHRAYERFCSIRGIR
jgi:hypothetical protein